MTRVLPFALCAFALLGPPARHGLPGSPGQTASFRSANELVVLPVVVTDRKGRYVTDLPQDRFAVYDNDRRVPLQLFTNEDTPVTVGLLIDTSGSMRPKIGEVVAATMAFARTSNPDDELFAIRFDDTVRDAIPERKMLLARDLEELKSAMLALMPNGQTTLYDALMAGFDRAADGTRPRKIMILISDGGDTSSRATLAQVVARARDSNVALYTIGLYDPDDVDRNPGVLKTLAQTGGGERFLPESPGKLMQICETIAREIRSGYTIGYAPPDHDGAFHRVRVEIEPRDRRFVVRTRPGYVAGAASTERERR